MQDQQELDNSGLEEFEKLQDKLNKLPSEKI